LIRTPFGELTVLFGVALYIIIKTSFGVKKMTNLKRENEKTIGIAVKTIGRAVKIIELMSSCLTIGTFANNVGLSQLPTVTVF